ncbi:MAG: hypothetical protein OSB58_22200 [Alphaproteobacteria bacterium]|jgi:chemotaxis protein histidine kinase CheA|nr:hypothetical protein [Alphaproteobacteria bacterium]
MTAPDQYRVIRPANRLFIKARLSDLTVTQMMSKAHKVMAAIAEGYSKWLQADSKALIKALDGLRENSNDPERKAELFRVAHDIRGQAAGFGYNLASDMGASLCQYLEQRDTLSAKDLHVIASHIDIIRACLSQSLKGDGGTIGQELRDELSGLIERVEQSDLAQLAQ